HCSNTHPMSVRTLLAIASCVLSVVIGLVLARGNTGAARALGRSRPVIGLSLDTLKEARWQADRDLFVKHANELGADVQVQSANSDDSVQMADCRTLITNKVDVLVIVPHDGAVMAGAVSAAHDAHIPVIAYDRIIKNSDLDLY